jgi:hypothetical protein
MRQSKLANQTHSTLQHVKGICWRWSSTLVEGTCTTASPAAFSPTGGYKGVIDLLLSRGVDIELRDTEVIRSLRR